MIIFCSDLQMNVKISVLIDEKLENNLRILQANLIKKSKKSVSFSDTVNQVLNKGIQHFNKKSSKGDSLII